MFFNHRKKELKRLSRKALLELYLRELEENEKLRSENGELKKQLEDKNINMSRFGTLAESALGIAGVFEACDRACEIYRENLMSSILCAYNSAPEVIPFDDKETEINSATDKNKTV